MLPNAKSHAQHLNASSVKLLSTIWAMFVLAEAEDTNRLFSTIPTFWVLIR